MLNQNQKVEIKVCLGSFSSWDAGWSTHWARLHGRNERMNLVCFPAGSQKKQVHLTTVSVEVYFPNRSENPDMSVNWREFNNEWHKYCTQSQSPFCFWTVSSQCIRSILWWWTLPAKGILIHFNLLSFSSFLRNPEIKVTTSPSVVEKTWKWESKSFELIMFSHPELHHIVTGLKDPLP